MLRLATEVAPELAQHDEDDIAHTQAPVTLSDRIPGNGMRESEGVTGL